MGTALRDTKGRLLPGQAALNPGGRPRLPPEVKALIESIGAAAVKRLAQMVQDEGAFGKDGWLPPQYQLRVLEMATDRAYGKAEITKQATNEVAYAADPASINTTMQRIYASMDFPEMRNCRAADTVNGKAAKAVEDAEVVDGGEGD
jgi:hypothetical protein